MQAGVVTGFEGYRDSEGWIPALEKLPRLFPKAQGRIKNVL